ncbi:MAG: hypothetical protein KDK66_01495 [Deltaproteobacteria bacterium]|nr:hypothetical protein [Deltaproteobacteria bacterium]
MTAKPEMTSPQDSQVTHNNLNQSSFPQAQEAIEVPLAEDIPELQAESSKTAYSDIFIHRGQWEGGASFYPGFSQLNSWISIGWYREDILPTVYFKGIELIDNTIILDRASLFLSPNSSLDIMVNLWQGSARLWQLTGARFSLRHCRKVSGPYGQDLPSHCRLHGQEVDGQTIPLLSKAQENFPSLLKEPNEKGIQGYLPLDVLFKEISKYKFIKKTEYSLSDNLQNSLEKFWLEGYQIKISHFIQEFGLMVLWEGDIFFTLRPHGERWSYDLDSEDFYLDLLPHQETNQVSLESEAPSSQSYLWLDQASLSSNPQGKLWLDQWMYPGIHFSQGPIEGTEKSKEVKVKANLKVNLSLNTPLGSLNLSGILFVKATTHHNEKGFLWSQFFLSLQEANLELIDPESHEKKISLKNFQLDLIYSQLPEQNLGGAYSASFYLNTEDASIPPFHFDKIHLGTELNAWQYQGSALPEAIELKSFELIAKEQEEEEELTIASEYTGELYWNSERSEAYIPQGGVKARIPMGLLLRTHSTQENPKNGKALAKLKKTWNLPRILEFKLAGKDVFINTELPFIKSDYGLSLDLTGFGLKNSLGEEVAVGSLFLGLLELSPTRLNGTFCLKELNLSWLEALDFYIGKISPDTFCMVTEDPEVSLESVKKIIFSQQNKEINEVKK